MQRFRLRNTCPAGQTSPAEDAAADAQAVLTGRVGLQKDKMVVLIIMKLLIGSGNRMHDRIGYLLNAGLPTKQDKQLRTASVE
jgi:hypothetical protein